VKSKSLHRWDVTPEEAIALQMQLAKKIKIVKPKNELQLVAGADAIFDEQKSLCLAAVVVWDIKTQNVIEKQLLKIPLQFPYVPGLLSFREGPAILMVLKKLKNKPDAIMCDGQGLAHPRRFGLACHIGLLTELPTLGCAKSRLIGCYNEPGYYRGDEEPLVDRDEVVGTILRTRDRVKPVFVSVGHNIDLPTATRLVLDCAIRYRLPEPTRLADKFLRHFFKKN
jgi:deoxyribonuclease V